MPAAEQTRVLAEDTITQLHSMHSNQLVALLRNEVERVRRRKTGTAPDDHISDIIDQAIGEPATVAAIHRYVDAALRLAAHLRTHGTDPDVIRVCQTYAPLAVQAANQYVPLDDLTGPAGVSRAALARTSTGATTPQPGKAVSIVAGALCFDIVRVADQAREQHQQDSVPTTVTVTAADFAAAAPAINNEPDRWYDVMHDLARTVLIETPVHVDPAFRDRLHQQIDQLLDSGRLHAAATLGLLLTDPVLLDRTAALFGLARDIAGFLPNGPFNSPFGSLGNDL